MEFASWNIPASASSASAGRKGTTEYQMLRNSGGTRKRSAGSVPPLDEDTLEELDVMPTKVRRTHMELVSARDHIAALEQQLSARDAVIDILVSQLRGSGGSGGAATSSSAGVAYGGRDTVGTSFKYPNLQVRADPLIPGAPIQVPFFNTTVDTELAPPAAQFTNYVAPASSTHADPKTKPGSASPVVDPNAAFLLPSTASPDLAIANAVLRAVKPSAAPTTLLSTVAATAKPAAAAAAAAAPKALLPPPPAAVVVKPKPAAAAPTLALQHPTLLKQQQQQQQKNAPPPPPPTPPVVVDAGVDDELEEYADEEEVVAEEEPAAAAEEEEEEDDEVPVYVQVKVSAKKPPMGFFMMPSTGYLHRVAKDEDGDPALGELVAKYNPVTKTIIEQYVPQL